jgi:hypothetical protein
MRSVWALFLVACTGTEPTATEADCERIRTDWQGIYDELVSNTVCTMDEDCHAPYAGCAVGFGGCQVAVSTVITQADIDEVVAGYTAEAEAVECEATTAVCDCYGGYEATCDQGRCVLAGPFYD